MTQYYKMPGLSLSNANLSTRVLLSLFLLSVLAGLAVALLQYQARAEFTVQGSIEWIRGNEADLEARAIKPAKTYRELVAITHDHAFALPILLFVLLHLVALTSIGERAKIALYLAGFLSLAAALSAPWLVAYRGPGWNVLMRWSGMLLCAVIALSAALGLFEMWLARPLRRLGRRPEPPAPDPLVRRPPRDPAG